MKSFLKSVLTVCILSLPFSGIAQKVAFLDLDSLLSIMPEMIDAKKKSADHYKQLEIQLADMQKTFNDKYAEYQANEKNFTELIKSTKMKELQDMDQRLREYQVQAQTEFQKANEDLQKPINDKAKKAIEKVAKAKGYKMVIDSSLGVLLYTDPADDIFNLVKAELGIK